MPGLIGKKLGMTTLFSEDGQATPVTVIEAGPLRLFLSEPKIKINMKLYSWVSVLKKKNI